MITLIKNPWYWVTVFVLTGAFLTFSFYLMPKEEEEKCSCQIVYPPYPYFLNEKEFSTVKIYTPAYTDIRESPIIEIIWDGKTVFNDRLPHVKGLHPTGMPLCLRGIIANPGKHVLEVEDAQGRREKTELDLKPGDRFGIWLFGDDKNGNPVLIEKMGTDYSLM